MSGLIPLIRVPRTALGWVEHPAAESYFTLASDLRSAEKLLARLESTGAQDLDAELLSDGRVRVTWAKAYPG